MAFVIAWSCPFTMCGRTFKLEVWFNHHVREHLRFAEIRRIEYSDEEFSATSECISVTIPISVYKDILEYLDDLVRKSRPYSPEMPISSMRTIMPCGKSWWCGDDMSHPSSDIVVINRKVDRTVYFID